MLGEVPEAGNGPGKIGEKAEGVDEEKGREFDSAKQEHHSGKDGEDPDLHGENEEEGEFVIGKKSGEGEKEREVKDL